MQCSGVQAMAWYRYSGHNEKVLRSQVALMVSCICILYYTTVYCMYTCPTYTVWMERNTEAMELMLGSPLAPATAPATPCCLMLGPAPHRHHHHHHHHHILLCSLHCTLLNRARAIQYRLYY